MTDMLFTSIIFRTLTLIPRFWDIALVAAIVFTLLWIAFRIIHRGSDYFYFDPQDCFVAKTAENSEGRVFPLSAKNATFEPMLKHYVGVVQLVITVSAASIAFGGNNQPSPVTTAKLLLAWCVFYGVLFCATLIWRYDEYAQSVKSYTIFWYSTVFALGFSCLICFMLGYLAWGWALSR